MLFKKYFELIHAGIPSLVLEEMFAVGKPMFQFKQGVMQVKEDETSTFLKQLGSDKSVELLQKFVIVNEQIEPSLNKAIVSPEEYNETSKLVSNMKEEENSTYTIENYNYNSFNIKTSADNDGILYWADGYDEGWHAYVNGKEVPVYRVNINFKAISLPKGNSIVSFTYNPFLFRIGLFVFYGVFAACILASVLSKSLDVITNAKNGRIN